jgi:hypothetical protein|nr:MAG TPA: hypothetical protein [Caudoviricetes sp.]
MTNEEFEKIWAEIEEQNARDIAEWDALPEEEKERIFLEFTSNPANERICGYRMERHRGADGKWVYDTISEFDDDYVSDTDENGVHFL